MFPDKIKTTDGLLLRTFVEKAIGRPRASLVFVHGMGDHSRSLPNRNFSRSISESGYSVYAFDLRGHGQSQGESQYVDRWQRYHDDLAAVLEKVRDDISIPVYLVGISMGGLLAIDFSIESGHRVDGVVAVAPALSSKGASPLVKMSVKVLSALAPQISINSGLDLSNISRDIDSLAEYTADPYFRTMVTPRLGNEVLRSIERVQKNANRIAVPLLILHGIEDRIAPVDGSRTFVKAAPSRCSLITFDGAFHNLFIETNKLEVFSSIITWLNERFKERGI